MRKEEKDKCNEHNIVKKTVDINQSILIINLNVNDINTPN